MGTATIVLEIPAVTEAQATTLKTAVAALPTLPANARITVSYSSSL